MSENTVLSTPDSFFEIEDITVKPLVIPDTIPAWGGKTVYIKQLTRGVQDQYLQRQFASTRLKQDAKAKNQEISAISLYGHDAWLCVKGICKPDGSPMFTEKDAAKLNEKSGEAIGWIAKQIVEFSGMSGDVKPEDEVKNS